MEQNELYPSETYIVYASDDGFTEILGVSLVSLYKNSQNMDAIHVDILDSRISSLNRSRMEKVARRYHEPMPVWIEARDISKEVGMSAAIGRGSLS